MKISEVINILQKYKEEYGDINVALISNIGEQNTVNNIDVLSFYDESDPDYSFPLPALQMDPSVRKYACLQNRQL